MRSSNCCGKSWTCEPNGCSPDLQELPEEFDDVLIGCAGLGLELTALENRRLHTFGFLGDPEERLHEILRLRGRDRRPIGRLLLAPLRYAPWIRSY